MQLGDQVKPMFNQKEVEEGRSRLGEREEERGEEEI